MIDFNKSRPPWQEERGPRHGNNRHWIARIKKVERKRRRKRENGLDKSPSAC